MSGVTLEQVSKHFGSVRGVAELDVEIRPGEFFTFLGPSGCGKTTTLRMIAGFYFPTSGRIRFGERDVTDLPPNKRNTGMVFQNYALFPHMSVFENIAFGLQVRKLPRQEIKKRVERALALVHLEGYGGRRIDQLSGGQQQRVALARALVIEPQILLLDEPLSNLDAKLREDTRLEIKRLQLELGITTIYVTHDQAEAMAMSDRILVMNSGIVQQIGTPDEIYNRPLNRFVASFIGETNLWEGTVSRLAGEEAELTLAPGLVLSGIRTNASPLCRLAPGERTTVSIRPECIREAGPQEQRNVVRGKILVAEFTGANVHYVARIGSLLLRATFVNQGHRLRRRGEELALHIPAESIYFLG
ncbi:ABC transporter ATP-binding protein [Brevibacillus marinus]|uniref:ABC transporter ATP-binding protein n=1 Tax=Brevibacillus marinus TaxID=2496837 RepID=UPI000F82998D|nr:ABC transporter ATP-binding protein [Brevibacillus marinus]